MKTAYGSVPFVEQSEFYRRKIPTPTAGWTDIYNAEHDYAAVVAGANRREIIEDFAMVIQDFIDNGKTLDQFRTEFDRIVAQYGWDYHGGRNWRSRIIYETNLRSSYQAGRYRQLQELTSVMPYWQYVHSDAVTHPRLEHVGWNGLILHHSDPWWKTHFPINAWGCQCTVIARSEADLKRLKRTSDRAPAIEWEERLIGKHGNNPRMVRVPKGIDPGFEHIPGASRLESQVPPPLSSESGQNKASRRITYIPHRAEPNVSLPEPRQVKAEQILPSGLEDKVYIDRFLNEFGATEEMPTIFTDAVGEPLVIGKELFTSRSGHSKLQKRDRAKYMNLLANALKSPDEIWVRAEYYHDLKLLTVRRRYIARFEVEGQSGNVPTLAVFEVGKDGWSGVTNFVAEKDSYLEQVRTGILLYRREP